MTWYGLMNNYPCETFDSNTIKIRFKVKNHLSQIQFGRLGFPLFKSGTISCKVLKWLRLVLHIFQEYIARQINVWCPNWKPNLHISHITNFQMYFNNIQVNWIELSSNKIASVMSGVTSYHYYPWTFLSKRSKSVQSSLLKPTCSTPLPSLNFVCLNTIMGLSSLNRILITRFLKHSFA